MRLRPLLDLTRAKLVLARTRSHVAQHGLPAILVKFAGQAARVITAGSNVPLPLLLNGSSHRFAASRLSEAPGIVPAGLLTAGTMLLQEIETDLDLVHDVEVLIGTYARQNSSHYEWVLLDASGAILHRNAFCARGLADNHFVSIGLRTPVSRSRHGRLYLLLRSLDGTAGDCITTWLLFSGRQGRIIRLYGRGIRPAVRAVRANGSDQPWPNQGLCLSYRVNGSRQITEPTYRQPPVPEPVLQRSNAALPRCLWVISPEEWQASDLQVAGHDAVISDLDEALGLLREGAVDVLVLHASASKGPVQRLLTAAHTLYVPTAMLLPDDPERLRAGSSSPRSGGPTAPAEVHQLRAALRACSFALCPSAAAVRWAESERKRPVPVLSGQLLTPETRRGLLDAYRRLHRPRVSIVGILYNKAVELPAVLESYFQQTYEGEIEIVFVDDASPDQSCHVAETVFETLKGRLGRALDMRVLRNARNSGNCISRNIGIDAATGDILVVVDADCVLNRDFVKRHVEAHAFDDCEVVVGPMNIETAGEDPLLCLKQFERSPGLALQRSELQDPINKSSFLNCVTRNFSIKRSFVAEPLFDPLLTYSANPASGFGWEDVEMGYRLYKRGARIKFVEEAFSIHVSDPRPPAPGKAERSMRNFRRLFDKHPELASLARRWAVDTYRRLRQWTEESQTATTEDSLHLDRLFGERARLPSPVKCERRYRVLTYRWHVPHQYELYKLPFDFTLVTGLGNPSTDEWDYGQRPLPPNARLRTAADIDPTQYDFAILHFDENVLTPENTNGVIGPHWGLPFKWFREELDLPKVAVCHGTPQFYGQYNFHYDKPDLLQVIEHERLRMVDYLADVPVVCNSHQALREWGFRHARVIWHGFDPTEFLPATYERGIVSPLGPLVMSRPHYRGYFLYRQVFDGHWDELPPEELHVPEPHPLYGANAYAWGKYRNYIDELRRYTVYFNPTQRSPMPRARGEPMMCGVVTVSASNHDVDMFIRNGVNGFHSKDPAELRDQLRFLLRNPDAARRIGEASRQTAIELFNHDLFLGDWRNLVREVVG